MNGDRIIDFIVEELNEDGKRDNARGYTTWDYYEKDEEMKIEFMRNHQELYNKLLMFCAANNIIIVETQPATLETIIRYEKGGYYDE